MTESLGPSPSNMIGNISNDDIIALEYSHIKVCFEFLTKYDA